MKHAERTFRTDGGPDGAVFDLDAGKVEALPVVIDFVKINSEGKLQISMVGTAIEAEDLRKVQDLLAVMAGELLVDFTPKQGELAL
jgi:hypothetical protein